MIRVLTISALCLVCAAAAAWVYLTNSRHPDVTQCTECNFIIVSIDTLRPDHLGCYGYTRPTSPAIDSFAADSVRFATAISHGSSTTIAHASIFTSMIPAIHGATWAKKHAISAELPTLAEILSQHGYRTVSYNGGGQVSERFGFSRGFSVYDSWTTPDYEHERLRDRIQSGIDWLKSNRDQKFFMFLHSYEVHHPYAPDAEHQRLFNAGYSGPLVTPITEKLLYRTNIKQHRMNRADRDFVVGSYDAEIRGADQAFAALIEHLKQSGLYDKTVIILTSDHGEEFEERGWIGWHAHTLYDELLRVPLLVKLPQRISAGRTVDQQVRGIDLMPTILEIAAIPLPAHLQGSSLIPLIEGRPDPADRTTISERDVKREKRALSVRTERWKWYRESLYDLGADPLEKRNVAAEFPEVVEDLRAGLDAALNGAASEARPEIEVNPEMLEQLRSLGYLN